MPGTPQKQKWAAATTTKQTQKLAKKHQITLLRVIPTMTFIKGSLGGETSVLRTFRMSGKELVKERVSKERVRQGKS